MDASEISHAVLWLASDESRYVTGIELPVDAGLIVNTTNTAKTVAIAAGSA